MTLADVADLLGAEVLTRGDDLSKIQVVCACGCDLMSDVLAFTKEKTLLLTGLTTPQVVRTAEVSDLVGMVFVRGKRPSNDVIAMAEEKGIPLLLTCYPLYETCGLLYARGVSGTVLPNG